MSIVAAISVTGRGTASRWSRSVACGFRAGALLLGVGAALIGGSGLAAAETGDTAEPSPVGRPHMGLMDPAPVPPPKPVKPVLSRPAFPGPVVAVPAPIPKPPIKPIPRPKPKPRPVVLVPVDTDPPVVQVPGNTVPLYIDPALGPIYPWGPKPLPPKPVKAAVQLPDPARSPVVVRPVITSAPTEIR